MKLHVEICALYCKRRMCICSFQPHQPHNHTQIPVCSNLSLSIQNNSMYCRNISQLFKKYSFCITFTFIETMLQNKKNYITFNFVYAVDFVQHFLVIGGQSISLAHSFQINFWILYRYSWFIIRWNRKLLNKNTFSRW